MINTLNSEQLKAFKQLEKGYNVCLLGEGGTGKTYLLNCYIDKQRANGKNVVIMAPTGIAALKIGGNTMHSVCQVPIPAYGHYRFEIKQSQAQALIDADIVVIDEISMCRNDVFEYFSYVVDYATDYKKKHGISRRLQIIVSGDFYQLPPVVKKDEIKDFKRLALDESGYCFTSPLWAKFKFKTISLSTVVRQSDAEFINNLNKLRKGDKSCLKYFNKRVQPDYHNEDIIYICSTNAEAAAINDMALSKIDRPAYLYQARKEGFCGKDYTVDDNLILKPGARVVFMANDVINDEYKNGQFATVSECNTDSVIVTLDNGRCVEVRRNRWTTYKISVVNGQTSKSEIGAYYQLPLRLAYAITMHKTQGQTYDEAVVSPSSFAEGQLYVAISRVRSIDGLVLTAEILPEYIKVSSIVKAFYGGTYAVPNTRTQKKKELEKKAKAKVSKTGKKTKAKAKASTKSKVTKPKAKVSKRSTKPKTTKAKPKVAKATKAKVSKTTKATKTTKAKASKPSKKS